MTGNEQREFNFLRGKLDLVTKECERLNAENFALRELIDIFNQRLREHKFELENALLWNETGLKMIDKRRT